MTRDHVREPAVHHAMQANNSLPLSRSFFNPERQLSSLDVEMQRMASEMRRMYQDMQHLMPVDANPDSWRKKENYLLDNPVHHDQGSGRQLFRLQFDVRQFRPEEICVKTSDNNLTVHAKHEEKSEGKSVNREYHRQYVLPKDLNPENLVSKLSRDGVLTIEAPLPLTEGHKLIAIKHE
jgi:HSP20 family molecular chaperone IbpA